MNSIKRSLGRPRFAFPVDDSLPIFPRHSWSQKPIPMPKEAMRRAFCQDYRCPPTETYTSVRTPVPRCDLSKNQAIAWLGYYLEADGCRRPNDMKPNDVLHMWRQSPHKDTLGFYGVGSSSRQPESAMFNQVLRDCLDKASDDRTKWRPPKQVPPSPPKKTPFGGNSDSAQICQPFTLNSQALQKKLQQIPIGQRRLPPRKPLEKVFCTNRIYPCDPFGIVQQEDEKVSRVQALDRRRPPKKRPQGLSRLHRQCPMDCGEVQNAFSQYEWEKYKLDPRPYNTEFRQWLRGQKEIKSPEPKDYDQMYERFLQCFEQAPSPDPLCNIYELCCTPKPHDDCRKKGEHGQCDCGQTDGTQCNKYKYKYMVKETPKEKHKCKEIVDDEHKGKKKDKCKCKDKKREQERNIYIEFEREINEEREEPHEDPMEPVHKPKDKDKPKKIKQKKISKRVNAKSKKICPPCPPPKCPCEICNMMNRYRAEPDPPFIQQMKRAEKTRQLRDYYRQMCHREYVRNRCQEELRAPLHKCDPICSDNFFCQSPRLAEQCDCLGAVQDLQKLIAGCKDEFGDRKLLHRIERLRQRICQRMCDYIPS